MDPNTNPVAPTDGQTPASVASTNNPNEQIPPAVPSATEGAPANQPAEPTPEQMAKYLGTTVEGLEKAKKFYENNGGFDKVFEARKQEISTPKTQQPQQPVQPQDPAQIQQPAAQPQQTPNGLDMDYVEGRLVKEYFKELAANPDYANIADKLVDGTVMEEASKMFGINPIANGRINEAQIKHFCDMYSKSMPAVPASAPMTNTPTVQPMGEQFTGQINSTQDALKVIQENNAMVASGKGEHSKLKEAQEFLGKGFQSRHPVQKEFQPWQPKNG